MRKQILFIFLVFTQCAFSSHVIDLRLRGMGERQIRRDLISQDIRRMRRIPAYVHQEQVQRRTRCGGITVRDVMGLAKTAITLGISIAVIVVSFINR